MKFVVDRIEGNYAVCENLETREMIDISVEYLPENVNTGMCLKFENGILVQDCIEEEERRKRIEEKRKRLWNIED